MVKNKLGGARNRKQVKSPTPRTSEVQHDGPAQPAHVKKKLTKKVHFLKRVADSKHSALAARAGIKKKPHKRKDKQQKALPSLDSLADILAEVGKQPTQQEKQQQDKTEHDKQKGRTEQIRSGKARRVVTQLETTRMQQVLAHPQYQANPLAAIKSHLEAKLPTAAPPRQQQHQKSSKAKQRQKRLADTEEMHG